MSQQSLSTKEKNLMDTPMHVADDARILFEKAVKAPQTRGIGTEHERFLVHTATQKPVTYLEPHGIQWLLRTWAERYPHQKPIEENGAIIGLQSDGASITLEPGGQLELSGAVMQTLHQTHQELMTFETELNSLLPPEVTSLQLGFHPTATRSDFEFVPKARYAIMKQYMPKRGTRGLDMMLRTCTVQANLDYTDEADFVESFRLGLRLSPFLTALFANSSYKEGKPAQAASERGLVWEDTDPDRTGFPSVVFEPAFGYQAWIEYVLDVPMYFIRRGYNYTDVTGASFRQFMKEGMASYTATLQDFADHLTTVFTWVRAKPYLEIRSADAGNTQALMGLPAICKGLFYDDATKKEAMTLLGSLNAPSLRVLQKEAAQLGLSTTWNNKPFSYWCNLLIDLARAGLNKQGQQEESYLPLIT